MKALNVLASLLAGAGAVIGQTMLSLGPLVTGLVLAAACSVVARRAKATSR